MRNLFLVVAVLLGTAAHASNLPTAATELNTYRQEIKQIGAFELLILWQGPNIAKAGATCALSIVTAAATVTCDTLPLTNPVAEWLANKANRDYKSYDDLYSWETLAKMAAPTVGGAVVTGYDVLDYMVKLAAGRTSEMEWKNFFQVYGSTIAVWDAVAGSDSRCAVNLAKIAMIRAELISRIFGNHVEPMTPMYSPR